MRTLQKIKNIYLRRVAHISDGPTPGSSHRDLQCLTTLQSDEQYDTIDNWQTSRPRRDAETYLRDLITSLYITNSHQGRFVTLAGDRYMFPPRGILKLQGL